MVKNQWAIERSVGGKGIGKRGPGRSGIEMLDELIAKELPNLAEH